METLTYGSGRASGCDSPGLLNVRPALGTPVPKAGNGSSKPSKLPISVSPHANDNTA